MNIYEFIDSLDFENYDYLYHETSKGIGEKIMEEGLLVDGTNILGVNNPLFTTTVPLKESIVSDPNDFIALLEEEKSVSRIRDVSEMIIICAPKEYDLQLITHEPCRDEEGNKYIGFVSPEFIYGVINLRTLSFTPNENCLHSEMLSATNYIPKK